jgi:hypothetical protein
MTTAEYNIVLETARAASRAFSVAQKAYRAGGIGDNAFLAAKAEYDESERVFSAARGELADQDAKDDAQAVAVEAMWKERQGEDYGTY